MHRWLPVTICALAACMGVRGYQTAEPGSTVKVEAGTTGPSRLGESPNGFAAENCTLVQAIASAWEIDPLFVLGPVWFSQERLNVTATGPNARSLLRNELQQRYRLIAERGSRPQKVWVIRGTAANSSLQAAEVLDSSNKRRATWSASMASVSGAWSIEDLAGLLQRALKASVQDETRIGGSYVISLQLNLRDPAALIRTVREQLGLELTEEIRDVPVLVVTSSHVPAEKRTFACVAAPEIRKSLADLPLMDDLVRTWEQRFGPRRQLLEAHRGDLFVAMAAQDAVRARPHLRAEWDWLLQAHAAFPDKTVGEFLHARLFADLRPRYAETTLRSVLAREPQFPWAKLLLASILLKTNRTGPEAEQLLSAFRFACPENLDDLPYYAALSDAAVVRRARSEFERIVPRRIDEAGFAAYRDLWQLRKRTWESAEDAYRESIRRDLLQLRAHDRTDSPAWVATVLHGYRLIGDDATAQQLRNRIIDRTRSAQIAYELVRGGADASLEMLKEWRQRWPNLPQIYLEEADHSGVDIDAHIELSHRYPDLLTEVPVELRAAELLAAKDRALQLVQSALRKVEEQEHYPSTSEISLVQQASQTRLRDIKSRCEQLLKQLTQK